MNDVLVNMMEVLRLEDSVQGYVQMLEVIQQNCTNRFQKNALVAKNTLYINQNLKNILNMFVVHVKKRF